jgi:hypothetical protein
VAPPAVPESLRRSLLDHSPLAYSQEHVKTGNETT